MPSAADSPCVVFTDERRRQTRYDIYCRVRVKKKEDLSICIWWCSRPRTSRVRSLQSMNSNEFRYLNTFEWYIIGTTQMCVFVVSSSRRFASTFFLSFFLFFFRRTARRPRSRNAHVSRETSEFTFFFPKRYNHTRASIVFVNLRFIFLRSIITIIIIVTFPTADGYDRKFYLWNLLLWSMKYIGIELSTYAYVLL